MSPTISSSSLRAKMFELATGPNAQVEDDDGEVYDSNGDVT